MNKWISVNERLPERELLERMHRFPKISLLIDCKACKERAACDQVPYDCPLDEPPLKYPRIIKESGYTAYFMEIQPLGDGLELPIYRFPGGSRCVDFPSACEVIEW